MRRALRGALAAVLLLGGCASPQVLRPFSSDLCSFFPEGDGTDPRRWCECCARHDIVYWRGGSAEERKRADVEFRHCVAERGGPARLMYYGVRAGGLPLWPTPFRWAFGWGYGRGYAPLNEEERLRADRLLEEAPPVSAMCEAQR